MATVEQTERGTAGSQTIHKDLQLRKLYTVICVGALPAPVFVTKMNKLLFALRIKRLRLPDGASLHTVRHRGALSFQGAI